MTLQPGTRLGPYEVVGPIGAGGMGEVYKAKDTRLDRTVAVKVLPPLLAMDPEFRERFDREARSISALAHPNICTLHDIGEHRQEDGTAARFLVMEYLEGETLAARLERGALPLAEALAVAIDIASALDKAHRHGVVHRDLKPANVMLTRTGAKLLDFGLAKSSTPGAFSAATMLATMTSPPGGMQTGAPLTTRGTILGTIQYMAPEQVEGEEAGPRADLFAFGAVLFEMITGRKAFSGKSHASVLGAILKEEPPRVSQLQPLAPPALDRLVQACLAKDPEDRLQSAHDLLLQLRWIQEGGTSAQAAQVATSRRRWPRAAWIALAGVAALSIAALAASARWFEASPEAAKIQFTIPTPDPGSSVGLSLALSPDGRTLAYAAPRDANSPGILWVRQLDELQPRPLAGTEGAGSLFWSPDNRRIGFIAGGKLQAVDIGGGPPQLIATLSVTFMGGTWNADGTILFAHGSSASNARLARVSDRGGVITPVIEPDGSQQQNALMAPHFLPDGRRFLYFASSGDPAARAVYAGSLDGGPSKMLMRSTSSAIFAPPGFLVYLRDGSLVAQPFDPARLVVTGDPIRIAESVMHSRLTGRVMVTASQNGVLAYRSGSMNDPLSQLAWLDRKGAVMRTVGDPAPYNQLRLSPDEKRAAVVLPDQRALGYNIWTMDLKSGIVTQTTFAANANDPAWGPDGRSVIFGAVGKSKRDFYQQAIGAPTGTLVYEAPEDPKWLSDVSRDGRFVLFHQPQPGRLFAVSVAEKKATLLAETSGTFDGAHFSPDGRWVAYQSNESGQHEVWVAAFPAFDQRRRVSARGGGQAFWRGDGRELFYVTLDGKMMSVTVTPEAGGALDFGAPVELFQSPLVRPLMTLDQYSVTSDGQRFLFLQPHGQGSAVAAPLTVVVNWAKGLGR